MENFEWVDIPTFEGKYQVNEFGDIRSVNYKQTGKLVVLKTRLIRGYLKVDLYKDSRRITISNHQAVAMAFLGHTLGDHNLTVNHKDFNKLNNHKDNLEIISLRENSSYKSDRGNRLIGTHYNKLNGKFTAKIFYNNKRYILGHFDFEVDANVAYNKALSDIQNNIPISEYRPIRTSKYKNIHFSMVTNKWSVNLRINGYNYCRSFDTEEMALKSLNEVKYKLSNGISINKKQDSSKHIGICKEKSSGLWRSYIGRNAIGRFLTESEAKDARDNSLILLDNGKTIEDIRKLYRFKLRKGLTH